jgi:hypothetical protein
MVNQKSNSNLSSEEEIIEKVVKEAKRNARKEGFKWDTDKHLRKAIRKALSLQRQENERDEQLRENNLQQTFQDGFAIGMQEQELQPIEVDFGFLGKFNMENKKKFENLMKMQYEGGYKKAAEKYQELLSTLQEKIEEKSFLNKNWSNGKLIFLQEILSIFDDALKEIGQ